MLIYKLYRKEKISLSFVILSVSLWIGGAIIGLAPGTLHRGGDIAHGGILMLWSGFKMLIVQYVLWCTIILVLIDAISRGSLRATIKSIWLEFSLAFVSLLFTLVAHTTMQSYSGLDIFLLLSSIKLFSALLDRSTKKNTDKILGIITVILSIGYLVHQITLVGACKQMYTYNHDIIERYKASPDGIIRYTKADLTPWISPFVRDFVKTINGTYREWFEYNVSLAHGSEDKVIKIFSASDYEALASHLSAQTVTPRLNSPHFYDLEDFIVASEDSLTAVGDTVVIKSYCGENHNPMVSKLASSILGRNIDKTELVEVIPIDSLTLINSRWGKYRAIKKESNKTIQSIHIKNTSMQDVISVGEKMCKKISILIPFYNEEDVLPILFERIDNFIKDRNKYEWEILMVNDGSSDHSLDMVKSYREKDLRWHYVDLSRNFGKETAMMAGFDYVTGDCVVIMDADLQDPPEIIDEMVKLWEQGYDDIYGRRKTRGQEPWLRKKLTLLYYNILQHLTKIPVLQNTGDFRLLDRMCIEALKKLRETQRYTKGLYCWIGFKKAEVLFDRGDRAAGTSKWNFFKLLSLAIEGITSYTTVPLRIATVMGLITSLGSLVLMFYYLIKTILWDDPVSGFPTMIVVMLFLGGSILFSLGILGEYIGRIFSEVKGRPAYFVREVDGLLSVKKNLSGQSININKYE